MDMLFEAFDPWWIGLVWLAGAVAVGYAVPSVFARRLHLRRDLFLVPYTLAVGTLLIAYAVATRVDVIVLATRNWALGIAVAVALSVPYVRSFWKRDG